MSRSLKASGFDATDSMVLLGSMRIEATDENSLPTFQIDAYSGGELHLKNAPYPVVADLNGMEAAGDSLPVLRDHDGRQVVGHTRAVDIDRSSWAVRASGVVSGTGQMASEVLADAKNGFPWQASINAVMKKPPELVRRGSKVTVNGREFEGPVLVARKTLLREITVTALGADIGGTATRIAASLSGGDQMDKEFLKWLEAKGWDDPDDLSEDQIKTLEASWKAEQKSDDPPDPPPEPKDIKAADTDDDSVKARRKAIADDARRIEAIHKLHSEQYGGRHLTIEATAIEEGWEPEKFELACMREDRPKAPAIHGIDHDRGPKVIEAALCRSVGIRDVDEQYEPKILEACDRDFRRGIGLQEMLVLQARANGWGGTMFRRDMDTMREILGYCFPNSPGVPANIRAAGSFTGHTLAGNILSNTANKAILESFNAVESAWRQVAAIGRVSDFKTATRYRLTGDATYEELGSGGEIQHGTLDALSYTIRAKTYARMFALRREDIINDDLGAFDGLRTRIGRGAALKINNVFWTEFLDNSTFFAAGNSNYVTGAAYSLAGADPVAALAYAEQTFMDQTDPDGDPIAVEPAKLLVPTAQYANAKELYESTAIVTGGASTKTRQPTKNVFAGRFDPVVSAYLGNSNYTGYSTLAWYLLARPEDGAVIEIAFLDGQQTPTVESADADFNVLGIQLRGFHDFGVSKQEYRFGVKMKGEA